MASLPCLAICFILQVVKVSLGTRGLVCYTLQNSIVEGVTFKVHCIKFLSFCPQHTVLIFISFFHSVKNLISYYPAPNPYGGKRTTKQHPGGHDNSEENHFIPSSITNIIFIINLINSNIC